MLWWLSWQCLVYKPRSTIARVLILTARIEERNINGIRVNTTRLKILSNLPKPQLINALNDLAVDTQLDMDLLYRLVDHRL